MSGLIAPDQLQAIAGASLERACELARVAERPMPADLEGVVVRLVARAHPYGGNTLERALGEAARLAWALATGPGARR